MRKSVVRRPTILLLATLAVASLPGCAQGCRKQQKPSSTECAIRLSPADPSVAAPGETTLEVSRVAAMLVVPLATLRKSIEAKVPTRVAAETDRDLGTPGKLTYTVDRSPFVLSMKEDRLVVRSDLTAQVSVCKPLGLLGCQPYATCSPTMKFEASVPIALGKDWTVPASTVRIDVVKRCVVTLLEVDVTPLIEERLGAEAKKIQARIAKAVPAFKPDIDRAWEKLQGRLPVAGKACATLGPQTPLQGPARIADDALLAGAGLLAHPSVEWPCPEPAPKATPLPSLSQDPKLPPGTFELHVPVRVATNVLVDEWRPKVEGTLVVGAEQLRVGSLGLRGAKTGLVLDVTLSGSTCGVLSMIGVPAWDAKRRVLVIASLSPRTAGAGLQAVADALRPKLELSLPLDEESLAKLIADLRPVVPGEGPELEISVTEKKSEGVVWTARGIEARFGLVGKLRVAMK